VTDARPDFAVAADENFNGRVLRGLQRRLPSLDAIRIQDTELEGAEDPAILEWAAHENRVLLSHDEETLIGFARQRLAAGALMAGLVIVKDEAPIGQAIEDLELFLLASTPQEVQGQIYFLPFPR
jgi:hypothetical protein